MISLINAEFMYMHAREVWVYMYACVSMYLARKKPLLWPFTCVWLYVQVCMYTYKHMHKRENMYASFIVHIYTYTCTNASLIMHNGHRHCDSARVAAFCRQRMHILQNCMRTLMILARRGRLTCVCVSRSRISMFVTRNGTETMLMLKAFLLPLY